MRCRVLHLPSATYLYYDRKERDVAYCYTQFEIDVKHFPTLNRDAISPIFPSKKEARKCIAIWVGSKNEGLYFQEDFLPSLITHFEIVPVNNV